MLSLVRDNELVDSHLTRHQKYLLLFCQSRLFLSGLYVWTAVKHNHIFSPSSLCFVNTPPLLRRLTALTAVRIVKTVVGAVYSCFFSYGLFAGSAGPRRPALWPLILSTLHGGFRVRPQSQRPLPAAPVLISTSRHTGSAHTRRSLHLNEPRKSWAGLSSAHTPALYPLAPQDSECTYGGKTSCGEMQDYTWTKGWECLKEFNYDISPLSLLKKRGGAM